MSLFTYVPLDFTENVASCFAPPFRFLKPTVHLLHLEGLYRPIPASKNPEFFRNDWAVQAFRGFRALKDRFPSNRVQSFLSVGTGTGLDTIGAIECFGPSRIFVTELLDADAIKAEQNIRGSLMDRIAQSVHVNSARFDVLSDSMPTDLKSFDLIYENLPNLPMQVQLKPNCDQPVTASFLNISNGRDIPGSITHWLLTSHYVALRRLKPMLNPGGAIICQIGGRMPLETIAEMFRQLGYTMTRLVYDLKQQNECESNLTGYANWEEKSGIQFRFYPAELMEEISQLKGYDRFAGFADAPEKLDDFLEGKAMSASEAVARFRKGHPIAHLFHCLAGFVADGG